MGVWGTGIFSDDNASDLRDDYRDFIGDGLSGAEATDRLMAEWHPQGDRDLEPVFWLALAVTQWSYGRLEQRVKLEALRVIGDGSAIRPWIGSPDQRKRRAVLDAAKEKLESPQPAEKSIKKRKLATCDWERGDLIAYKMTTGEYVVIRMLDMHIDRGGACPDCELFDWRGPELPQEGLADSTPVRELQDWGGGKRFMILPTGRRFLKGRVIRLNVRHALAENYSRVPRGYPNPTRVTSWQDFDKLLAESFGFQS